MQWDPMRWADEVDAPGVVRGASTGFTVLVLGGLAAPLGALVPVAGTVWLPVVALVAFVVAAARVGTAPRPWLHGMVAALSAYLLVLPLVLLGGSHDVGQMGLTFLAAVLVGAGSGFLAGYRRDRLK
ncbi:hypothetical protein FPZ12_003210 [Amycolatopsis acidicola]|uniref:Uncharacterized protein n=1 Tax=Amycolatopsis acidicola TaxID=2596893 RepID=A0A5N0VJW7_9PSEU|nr:hypothetical protein [Amycolatopsis acidicola]KAA9165978.1 hypothetical protein FPZ12_003210 [Amycolatopsis acidicola]